MNQDDICEVKLILFESSNLYYFYFFLYICNVVKTEIGSMFQPKKKKGNENHCITKKQ